MEARGKRMEDLLLQLLEKNKPSSRVPVTRSTMLKRREELHVPMETVNERLLASPMSIRHGIIAHLERVHERLLPNPVIIRHGGKTFRSLKQSSL